MNTKNKQGVHKVAETSKDKIDVFGGNGEKVKVEQIGTIELKLESRFYLELFDIVYALSMKPSLISFSRLDKLSYSYSFSEGLFQLMFESRVVGTDILDGG